MATITQLRSAAKQGATLIVTSGVYEGEEVYYSPDGDELPWRVTGKTWLDRVHSSQVEIVLEQDCPSA
jgi:hypothetical protein